jgi:4-carboxymuconolactone decarboxylase
MSHPKDKIPARFLRFKEEYPDIAGAYAELGDATHGAGPLDEKTRALVKIAISGGAMLEGGFRSHVRKALSAGATEEEIKHVVLLSLPTIGFPATMAQMSWVEEVLGTSKNK